MIQEDKRLLLKDLCARLPYGVKCHYNCVVPIPRRELIKANSVDTLKGIVPMSDGHIGFIVGTDKVDALEGDIKPYLRPMSSMTEEEIEAMWDVYENDAAAEGASKITDLLNQWHLDHHHLIEKGLALEAPEDMYKTQ